MGHTPHPRTRGPELTTPAAITLLSWHLGMPPGTWWRVRHHGNRRRGWTTPGRGGSYSIDWGPNEDPGDATPPYFGRKTAVRIEWLGGGQGYSVCVEATLKLHTGHGYIRLHDLQAVGDPKDQEPVALLRGDGLVEREIR